MFSSRSVQIAALFSDVFGQALPNLCRSFYNETKAEMFFSVFAVALLAEGVDRNFDDREDCEFARTSPSSRRAWIEIRIPVRPAGSSRVALLAEGVDRNDVEKAKTLNLDVALLAEGVDRNRLSPPRNSGSSGSPSSRRAWIEISAGKMLSMKSSGRPPRGGRG